MQVALVLGSGGARGYAHIGVIDVLHERGHEITAIAGSSMGAMIGGLEAAGHLGEFADWATGLKQRDVLLLLDPAFGRPGAIRAERALAKVSGLLGGVLIEELPIAYVAVATDLGARREVWFRRGPVAAAVRASIAIPGVITPATLGSRTFVDGGLLNPVPMDPLLGFPADVTVAVSLSGPRAGSGVGSGAPVVGVAPAHGSAAWQAWWRSGLAEFERWSAKWRTRKDDTADARGAREVASHQVGAGADDAPTRENCADGGAGEPLRPGGQDSPEAIRNAFDVFTLSLEAVEAMLCRYRMASAPPDVHIQVPADSCGTLDFHRAPELIDLGRRLAEEALDRKGL